MASNPEESQDSRVFARVARVGVFLSALAVLGACGGSNGNGIASVFGASGSGGTVPEEFDPTLDEFGNERDTIWDLFVTDDPNVTLQVNRFIWNASLDVLSFLPVQQADPFTGVIVTGFGTPPGGGRSYRATVYVRDPALDARSLRVALVTRSGPADPDTVRAVEDAILTRARQLRIAESGL